jgi:hypothetical protein
MNNTMQKNDEVRPEMDDLLHDYFQAEMPRPWPTFQVPKPMRTKRTASFWARSSGRVALAACITLLVAGYLTLGGFFPRTQGPSGMEHEARDIGMKDPKTVKPTPRINSTEEPMGVESTHRKTK